MKLIWPKAFHFVGKSDSIGAHVPPEAIARHAVAVHDLLLLRGVGAGDRVALWLSQGADSIAAILGCWMAGAAFCVLPSFAGRSKTERSQERIEDVLAILRPRLILTAKDGELADAIPESVPVATLPDADTPVSDADPSTKIAARDPNDIAFIQFTSGSTGGVKGAVVRFGQLKANRDAVATRTQVTSSDCMVSWLPLYHDLGLMAVLLPLSRGCNLVLMETAHFVRRPSAWLDAMSRYRGTIAPAPPTALKLLSRRKALNVDLSSWRCGWIGGEMVFPGVLAEFEATYASAGLARGVLQPSYGMAETVVGISFGDPGDPWRVEDGVVSCGHPLDGIEMRLFGEDGEPVSAGEEGRIMVRGPSVMRGYFGLESFAEDAWFDTGDLGFERAGYLYVTGRAKEVLKRGAESFPASLVEAIAEDALGLSTGRAAAFNNPRADLGKEEIVLLVESRDWNEASASTVASAIASDLGLQVDVIRNTRGGRLPRTSSGKLMRQKAAKLYREGLV